ncbi:hypothetical protein ABID82_007288 [Methylobacterium sp. PvP062]|uniref:DUF4376 domain-containing protein n=1 Tax=Methylobacterium radiotolerans TaxID=31998 RepID=A0ABV2NPN8_9HYPH|nr:MULTISPECIES: DUF4376 domain-containing protein [unclassified Methylobacterium]MBP2494927.1 hypothetical protein [Methylobacterium sp. PvP105]MBP2505202.1 hypothetical protein [Methylobacterium sp. PvP109]MCX7333616.1 DUF4376 domain-containing protein [Hyphomicrobiales bacterium]
MRNFNASDWYWRLPNGTDIFASARGAIVGADDAALKAWSAPDDWEPTPCPVDASGAPTLVALREELARWGLALPDALAAAPSAADLVAYAAARRFAVETGGVVVNGVTVATDRDSQSMVANAYAGMQAGAVASVKFKAASGWIELTADQMKAVALAVFAHVQACFAAEDGCDAGINASPPTITTLAEVNAAFAGLAPAA